MEDPRSKNFTPAANCVTDYLRQYCAEVSKIVERVSCERLEMVFSILRDKLQNENRIYCAGNGGSAAIAAHLCCDWAKGTRMAGEPSLMVHSLMENTSLLTALANDIGYEEAVSQQLELYAKPGDAVVLLSCSGNSPNMVRAAQTARRLEVDTISFTGFDGGRLLTLSDVNVHIPIENYGMVEDCHQMLMHVLAQYLYQWRVKTSEPASLSSGQSAR